MPSEYDECGKHCLDCTCDNEKPKLTMEEMMTSEAIQSAIAPIITKYMHNKKPLIDALEWILSVVVNDYKNNLAVFENSWNDFKRDIDTDLIIDKDPSYHLWPYNTVIEEERNIERGYICRACAMKLNAIPPRDHVCCTWHRGVCEFCGEETNLCHTSDWDWPDDRHLESDRES